MNDELRMIVAVVLEVCCAMRHWTLPAVAPVMTVPHRVRVELAASCPAAKPTVVFRYWLTLLFSGLPPPSLCRTW
jgi:hypothetical protein